MAVAFHKLAPPPRDAPPDARFLTDRVRNARPADAPELAVNGHRSGTTPLSSVPWSGVTQEEQPRLSRG